MTAASGQAFEFPSRTDAVLADLLERRAEETPDQVFALFEDGTTWTHRQLAERAWGFAASLRDLLDVRQGEIVSAWLPNGREALLAWFGTNALGAVYAPLNTAYRGALLADVLNLLQTRVLIAHAELLDRLADLDLPHLQTIVVVGPLPHGMAGPRRVVPWSEVAGPPRRDRPAPERPVEPWDDATALLTSGTTGASKAVRRTYVQYRHYAYSTLEPLDAGPADRFYVCAPMFHGGADTPIYGMLAVGGSIYVGESFTASGFWDHVRRSGSTIAWIHSAMSLFLAKQPPRPDDADNPLRFAMLAPLIPGFREFAERFDVRLYMVYGMTEVACPFCIVDPVDRTSLGTGIDTGYELRLVDNHDIEVADGEPGQLVVRHRYPWVVSPGYVNMPEATARAWRNGWFHTGDVFVRRADGAFELHDRIKDSIRRRGENVSAVEVERELLAHPDIITAAVIGVEAELEEDILAYVMLRQGTVVEPLEIHEHLVPRLPYFALPRYIAIVDTLPTNQTLRVTKEALRPLGVPDGAWDRAAAGVTVDRERLGRAAGAQPT